MERNGDLNEAKAFAKAKKSPSNRESALLQEISPLPLVGRNDENKECLC
jgi:hypothetical protein